MRFTFSSFVAVVATFFVGSAVAAPTASHNLNRRALTTTTPYPSVPASSTPVAVNSYSFDAVTGTFSANLWIQNQAYTKTVQIFYSDLSGTWSASNVVTAAYVAAATNNFESWSVKNALSNMGPSSQFYLKVTMNGNTYYDSANSANYKISNQVQVKSFSCSGGFASGQILVQNIAYTKNVTAHFSDTTGSFASPILVAASYTGAGNNGYELWSFSSARAGVGSQFYIQYDVSGSTYYDSNGGSSANYKIASCPAITTTTATTSSTTSTTSTISSSTSTSTSTVISTTSTTSTTSSSISTTSTTTSTSTTSTVTPTCIPMQSFTYKSTGARFLVVEALSDTIFHYEVSELRTPPAGKIFLSPMVDSANLYNSLCLTSLSVSADKNTLETPRVRVTINPTDFSVTVFDKISNLVLTTFSYGSLSTGQINNNNALTQPQLKWTRELAQGVYGLAQTPGYDSNATQSLQDSEGNWLGLKLSSPDGFGNVMTGVQGGGSMAYTQLPVVYSVAPGGYNHAFFLDATQTLTWDLSSTVHTVTATSARSLRWFSIAGSSLLDIRKQYMNIVGKPSLVARHALGYNQGKFGYRNWQEAFTELDGLKAAHIPVDNLIFDLYWYGEVLGSGAASRFGALAWDTTNFPNPKNTTDYIRKNYGAGVTLIEEPYVGQNGPTAQMLVKNNAVVNDAGKPWFVNNNWWGVGYEIDHTNPTGAYLWAECKRCALISGCTVDPICKQYGLEATEQITELIGHWQDLGEPESFDGNGQYYGIVEDDGVALTTSHSVVNIYQFLITKYTFENYKNHSLPRRPNVLARTGAPGIQRYGGSLWSADIGSTYPSLRFHIGSKKHLSMAGIDFHSSDTGGFHRQGCTGTCIHDMYTVWLANSAWFDLPIKPHTCSQETGFTTTASAAVMGDLPSNVFNIRNRYKLLPLFYSLSYKASTVGEPIYTPLFMAYQEKPQLYRFGNQYLIGPIMASFTADNPYDTTQPQGRGVWLPANTQWYHIHTLANVTGKDDYTTNIPYFIPDGNGNTVFALPAYVPSGSIYPQAWVDNQTKNHRCWDRFDNSVVCPNYFRVVPGPYSSFTVYEDDGETMAYQNGVSLTITASQILNGATSTVTVNAAVGQAAPQYPAQRQLVVEFVIPVGYSGVSSVLVDGAALAQSSAAIDPTKNAQGWFIGGSNNRLVSVYGPTGSVFTAHTVSVTFK
ncbi:hypothetical protein HDU76_013533 [Blyttiomyces sp. JEL0837]|nr:hypothetical protein HDU76_013533 [Blyttiomyces sp. JEL0837]